MNKWHGKSHLDVPMGVDTMRNIGTMLGTCCAIVMDSSVNMVEASRNLMKFYHHESCGQCTPCREGTGWLEDTLNKLASGRGKRQRRRSPRRHLEQHDGQHDLRARGWNRDAHARVRPQVPEGIPRGSGEGPRALASPRRGRARRARGGCARERTCAHDVGGAA
jgi:hypothetical protein